MIHDSVLWITRVRAGRENGYMAQNPDQQEKYIAIWAKAVDTQMHFNEMSVKSRQLGLTFVAAALGVAIVLLSRDADFAFVVDLKFLKFQLHISVVLVLGAWLALAAVKVLDLNVYHRMLRGAVTFGEDFEENYMKEIFDLEKGMTQAISHFSRYDDAGKEILKSGKYKYTGSRKVTAEDKIRKFYRNAFIFLGIAAFSLFTLNNLGNWIEMYYSSPTESSSASKADAEIAKDEASGESAGAGESSGD